MLGAIENMKFLLYTGFGNLKTFGGSISIKMQGLRQWRLAGGVGGYQHLYPASTRDEGYGAKFLCPIMKLQNHLSAILYVDDTDLLHFNLMKDEHVEDIHAAI